MLPIILLAFLVALAVSLLWLSETKELFLPPPADDRVIPSCWIAKALRDQKRKNR